MPSRACLGAVWHEWAFPWLTDRAHSKMHSVKFDTFGFFCFMRKLAVRHCFRMMKSNIQNQVEIHEHLHCPLAILAGWSLFSCSDGTGPGLGRYGFAFSSPGLQAQAGLLSSTF